MKSILIALLFLPIASWAKCNTKLAKASGIYLQELETAHLPKYQSLGACEVLDRELANCSKKQIAKLNKSFNVKEVRGNYCQPYLPPYPSVDKDHFLKGAELFSWKEPGGYIWYALLPGTNRRKSSDELKKHRISYLYLEETVKQLPPQIEISWNFTHSVSDPSRLEFILPLKDKVESLSAKAKSSQINLKIKN
ncbi:MAG: hypothetical protein KDD61_18030 [Bdellovibrionales bacterium]|nr:hypothetical protein [Bdellovibrionales bacterium]